MKMQAFFRERGLAGRGNGNEPRVDAISGIIVGVALSATSSEKRQL